MIISEIKHNFIIVEGDGRFSSAILFPHNIHYNGSPVSLPFSLSILEKVKSNSSLLEKCTIVSNFGQDNKFSLLALDCSDIIQNVSLEGTLQSNKIYKGRLLQKYSVHLLFQ